MTEELMDVEQENVEDVNFSIPRGGPPRVTHVVGPFTCIRDFEDSVVNQLKVLKSELLDLDDDDENISVDELKVFTEDELVDMALKEEAFQGHEDTDKSNAGKYELSVEKDACSDIGRNVLTSESQSGIAVIESANSTKQRKPKKRKFYSRKMEERDADMKKLEHLAKIKEKQDEDRAAARLHCFNPSCKVNESDDSEFSERIERVKSLRFSCSEYKVKQSYIWENKPLQYPEVVLSIEVFSHTSQRQTKNQEFLVLGSQTLTELRDKIYCLTDSVMEKAGDHDSSGYFLIEDVFYSDLRDQSAIDYSEPVLDWIKNSRDEAEQKWSCILSGDIQKKRKSIAGEIKSLDLPRFKRAAMQKTQFCDLRFRLSTEYLYLHQGDCKHSIVFRDMRLIHHEDIQNRVAYPIVTFQRKLRTRKCDVCNIYRATLVTLDDKWAGENPCYFCNDCYFLLHHHNEDGSLLYNDFSVYDYAHE